MERDYLIRLYGETEYQKIINCTKEELFDKIREFLATDDKVEVHEKYLSIGAYELHIYTLEQCDYFSFYEFSNEYELVKETDTEVRRRWEKYLEKVRLRG